jgi:hypothetical protein
MCCEIAYPCSDPSVRACRISISRVPGRSSDFAGVVEGTRFHMSRVYTYHVDRLPIAQGTRRKTRCRPRARSRAITSCRVRADPLEGWASPRASRRMMAASQAADTGGGIWHPSRCMAMTCRALPRGIRCESTNESRLGANRARAMPNAPMVFVGPMVMRAEVMNDRGHREPPRRPPGPANS